MNVVINDVSEDSAKAVADEARKLGADVLLSTHDVSEHAQAQALANEALAQLGGIDVLVNNAGILRDAMLHKMTEAQWDDVIRVNLKGPFNMGQACAKVMMERKWGRIINLASVAWLGNIGQTNYSAAKAGVVGLTRTWAVELARHGITSNAIAPGFIDTVMTQSIPAEIKEKMVAQIPLKRIGAPEEIAAMVAFLASDEAGYVTGQVIHVDGGISCGI